jgi:hypothetical protein
MNPNIYFNNKKLTIILSFAVILSILYVMNFAQKSIIHVTAEGLSPTPTPVCSPAPPTNFLFLPFDTDTEGDWLEKMTSAFDHHYPDYRCSSSNAPTCEDSEKKIVLWNGDAAEPVKHYSRTPPYHEIDLVCYLPGATTNIVSCKNKIGIYGYRSVTDEVSVAFYDGHDGYDWGLRSGNQAQILASASGRIIDAKYEGPYGYTVTIDHLNGYKTKYSHLVPGSLDLPINGCVEAGTPIGLQGNSGGNYKTHLHYRVLHENRLTDPFGYCYECIGSPPDPLADFNGETSQNLWYGIYPRSVNRPPTRLSLSLVWDVFNSDFLGGPGDWPILNFSTTNYARFISDITISDGTLVSPSAALVKTWRIKNTGTTTWSSGYQLVFVSGNQMGAPSTVNLPHSVAPGQTVDISVNITAPASNGTYQGNWRMRNPSGTYFGDTIWVNIKVGTPSNNITIIADPPSPASTDQVRINARINNFPNLRALRILIDGQQLCELGAPEIQDCVWHTNNYTVGQHAISVEADDWTGPAWDNPERRTILYELTGSGIVNHAPYRPILIANPAYDWYVTIGNAPQLCAQEQGDPEGDPITQYRFVANASVGTVDSGWVGGSCHNFGSITPGTYEWRAQVKDNQGSISDWSDAWHFTVAPPGIEAFIDHFTPSSPSNAEEVRIYGCTSGHAGVNITMRVLVNDANDGTDSGQWHIIKEQGSPCFNDVDVPIWRTLEYADGPHLVRLVAWAIEPDAGDVYETVYTLNHRRPASPRLIAPVPSSGIITEAVYLNSQTVTFKWEPAIRAETYTLHVSTTTSPWNDPTPIFRQTFDQSVTEYTITFDQDYANLYWQVETSNDVGSSHSGAQRFGIDRQNPTCTLPDLISPSYESVFQINWNGSDNLAGIRTFDIQFMDSERGAWEDWLTTIPSDKTYELFTGQPGHTYYFRCRATDNAANTGDYPDTSDTSITVDPAGRPPTPWWDDSYAEKRNVTILNNMPNRLLPVGYPVRLHFDNNSTPTAAELYEASQSSPKCNDLRVVANDATELNRVVQSCSSTAIDIWFRSHISIPGGTSDNITHQLYYGNMSAGAPPADPNQVWYPYWEAGTTYLFFFQEGSGSITYDSSGNNRNCTIHSSVQWSPSKFGHGLRFNRASYGDSRSLNCGSAIPLTSFTIEFWYKPDADDGGYIAGELAGGGNGGGGNNWLLQNIEGRIRLDTWECPTCGSQEVRSNFNLRDAQYVGKWNHIAVTFNGINEVKFYINGALNSTKYLQDSGINTFTPPLEIGSVEGIRQIKANMGAFRISSGVKTSFPYGSFAAIINEPTTATGQVIIPPPTGSPDLVILSLNTYPNPDGGVIIEAVVQNQGELSTQNGFYTDLYIDHLPAGPGDYTGSLRFWINDPIESGEIVNLITVLADLSSLYDPEQLTISTFSGEADSQIQSEGTFTEISGTLFAQTDSAGLVREADVENNIYSAGTPVCLSSEDSFESDNTFMTASVLSVGTSQIHNFHVIGDQDWIKFTAEAGRTYQITTGNLDTFSDTYLYLYDTDGTTLLESNDDFDGSLASRIDWTAPAAGIYYAVVNHWNPNVGGCGTGYTVELMDVTPPIAPTGLTATAYSHNQINLSWIDNSDDETGFEVERSHDEFEWEYLASVVANETTFNDSDLSAETTYYYRVRAVNDAAPSEYSNIASATTTSPSTFVDQLATSEIAKSGTVIGSYQSTHFNDGSTQSIREVESGGRPANRYSYLEHVWTFDILSGTSIVLHTNAWAPASSDGDTFIFAYSTDDLNYIDMFTIVSTSDDENYATYSLPPTLSGPVYIRVKDSDRSAGNRALDTIYVDHMYIQTQITFSGPPEAPSDLSAIAVSTHQIDLAWIDNADNESGYEIERSLNGSDWQLINTVGLDVTTYNDPGLIAGTTYYYRVRAINFSGPSEFSNVADATTPQEITVHVGDLDGSSTLNNGGRWNAIVSILIHDINENPVVGAIVNGVWSGGVTGGATCTTDANGRCNVTKSNIKSNIGSVILTITNVTNESSIYQPDDNHDPDGDSDGTSITIYKP